MSTAAIFSSMSWRTAPASESELTHEPLPEKPVTMAIQEVARGELTATLKEKYLK